MFLLHELEEGGEVGAAKVIRRFQVREETSPRKPLEVVLANILQKQVPFRIACLFLLVLVLQFCATIGA